MKDHRRGGMPSAFPAAIPRRILTITGFWLGSALALVLSPILVLGAVIADVATRRSGWPTLRMVGFLLWFLWIEVSCEVVLLVALVTRPLRRHTTWTEENHRMMHWWLGRLEGAAKRVVGFNVDVDAPDDLGPGPLLVFGQHVSIVDAIAPGFLLGTKRGWYLRYTLTRGLRFVPCMDIVAHRIPNHFVARGTSDSTQGATLRILVRDMEADECAVIFPGGGLFTPAVLTRALEKLDERGSPQLDVAKTYRHVLPPRPGGVLAFFDGAPTADVLIVGHVGFEPVASIKRLWKVVPLRQPVEVKIWRHDRSTIPADEEGRLDWVYEQWAVMDDWIDERMRAREDEEALA